MGRAVDVVRWCGGLCCEGGADGVMCKVGRVSKVQLQLSATDVGCPHTGEDIASITILPPSSK